MCEDEWLGTLRQLLIRHPLARSGQKSLAYRTASRHDPNNASAHNLACHTPPVISSAPDDEQPNKPTREAERGSAALWEGARRTIRGVGMGLAWRLERTELERESGW